MDDLVPHIDRRAVFRERKLDDLDGAVDARAEAARGREIDGQRGQVRVPPIGLDGGVHFGPGENMHLPESGPSLALSRPGSTDSLARKSKKPATHGISTQF